MTVKLTIVGIRYYLQDDEKCFGRSWKDATELQLRESLEILFKNVPKGSKVRLYREPEGTEFPGSISVYDKDDFRRGSISKDEIPLIELALPLGTEMTGTITGHSAEDKCMYVEVENNVGIAEPHREDPPIDGDETIFRLPQQEQDLQRLTASVRDELKLLREGKTQSVTQLTDTAQRYAPLCCISLDEDTSQDRTPS